MSGWSVTNLMGIIGVLQAKFLSKLAPYPATGRHSKTNYDNFRDTIQSNGG
jgi:hypothetical protein